MNAAVKKAAGITAGILAGVTALCAAASAIYRKNHRIEDLQAMLRVYTEAPPEEPDPYFEPVNVDHHYPLSGYKILLKDQTFGEIWIPVLEDVALSEQPVERLKQQPDKRMLSFSSDGSVNAMAGLDISAHNNVTDWEAVKADGFDFVMLRVGYRTYGGGILHKDEKFKQYYKDAKAAGLLVGAYFFSQAVTEEEAVEEAALTLRTLEGCELDFPVAFDWEIIFDDDARTDNIPVEDLTNLTLAFCQNIEGNGYQPMIYQNKRTSLLKYDLPRLQGIPFWLAEYGDGPTYIYHYDMWQYSCKGEVSGVDGKVDLNLSFYDYSKPGFPAIHQPVPEGAVTPDEPDVTFETTDSTTTGTTSETTETTAETGTAETGTGETTTAKEDPS